MKLKAQIKFYANKFLKKHEEKSLKATSEVIPDIKKGNEEFMPYDSGETVDTAKIDDNKLIYTTSYAKNIYKNGGFGRGYFVTSYNNGKPIKFTKSKSLAKIRGFTPDLNDIKARPRWYDDHAKPKHSDEWVKKVKKTYKDSD